MKTFLRKLIACLLLAIGIPIGIVLSILTSLMWVPLLPGVGLNFYCNSFGLEPRKWVGNLEEFIFLCYGFAALWIVVPLEVLTNGGEDFC